MARVVCPSCKKTGNVPDSALGNRIKCPNCGERFVTPTLPPSKTEGKPLAPPRVATRDASNITLDLGDDLPAEQTKRVPAYASIPRPAYVPPQPVAQVTPPVLEKPATKVCMYCGESILAVALKCKHCNEIIDPALRAAEEAKAIARQQHAPIVNVNTAVSQTAGGGVVVVRKRIVSRMLTVGLALIPFGIVLSAVGLRDVGLVCVGIGILMVPIGAGLTMVRLMLS